ncbi:hypothetical protein BCR35DRAFT_306970 [Leucosporidium creatinivorum]|uniref:DHHA2 domain-containing protein n=1 Tax=Leucosporidium creatinivorum TaxID=106004 RepID=A0A1Y2EQN2_9BASI|nr:hypothetical protein BCR35DRAFT_306970 [Leucosporidium creatinivorum]
MLPLQLSSALVALCALLPTSAALPSLPQQQTFGEDARAFAPLSADPAFDVTKYKDGGPPSPFPPSPTPGNETGHGHFSIWSRETKEEFLRDVSSNSAQDWTLVMGNEAGDLDSMVSALALAYTLSHDSKNPQKAVALLQTEQDALYLRPENALALHYARMATHHRDLLTIDELPVKPSEMWHRIKGIALVDHNVPLSRWGNATVLAILDHHEDRGHAPKAHPRVIEPSGSCSSLIARYMFERLDTIKKNGAEVLHGKLPTELLELLLRTIAIDTSGLKKEQRQPVDKESAETLFELSSWKKGKLKKKMGEIDDELSKAKKNLADLDVRALLRRDWKGDAVETASTKYPALALGFASSPVSLEEQILRTPEGTSPEWFAIERAWTSEIGADVSVCLTNFRDDDGTKTREIALVVAHGFGKRLSTRAATSLFDALKHAIENAGVELSPWSRPDGKPLLPRRGVWQLGEGSEASRKFWRPIIEKAAREWSG